MKDKFLKELYLNTVSIVLRDVPDKYVDNLKNGYYNFLVSKYASVDIVDDMYNDALIGETNENKEFFSTLSLDDRLGFLIEDKYLEFIKQHFFNAKQLVQKIDEGFKYQSFDIEELKSKLNSSLEKVYDFNRLRALNMINSAIVDYQYVLGEHKKLNAI